MPQTAASPSLPDDAVPPRYEVEFVQDVRIPTGDGDVTLSGDLYRPHHSDPVPALLMVLPYRKDGAAGIAAQASFRWYAQRGYACMLVDFRGTGSSDGVMRPPFDPGEADDAVAAIEWLAAQPWCTGSVGMWGASYGGIMSMRTAARRPPALKAIIPIVGMIDMEHDFAHPGGVRGGFASLLSWGVGNLAAQLLPPLHAHHSEAEQSRWRKRLHEAEPYMLDLFRHGPGDPVWRERVVDPSTITVPSLCVAGWRDLFCDSSIRAYEEIPAPKKLIAGPWMHTQPQDSPFDALDFLPIALRWWDHWLRGIDNGVMDEPAVRLFTQGSQPAWRAYKSWPPAKAELSLATGADTTLSAGPGDDRPEGVIARYLPDPTTGPLSGLWSNATAGFGLPLDEHEDDSRAVSATSEPVTDDITISGRPEVTVRLATGSGNGVPERIVARLTDVDPQGRSTLIASGLVRVPAPTDEVRVALWPTSYRVAAGHRLRVVLGDSDFPRLWPLVEPPSWAITGIDLAAPIETDDDGTPIELPAPAPAVEPPLGVWMEPRWTITRDPIRDGVEVTVGVASLAYTPGREHRLETRLEKRASVQRDQPESAAMRVNDRHVVTLGTGEVIIVSTSARLTRTSLWARGEVTIDGVNVYSRVWEASATPDREVS